MSGFLAAMVVGVAAGFALGAVFPSFSLSFAVVGELFLRALKMVVLPLIIVSIANAIINMETIEKFKRIGLRAIFYYTTTTALAVLTGLLVVALFRPGVGVSLSGAEVKVKEAAFSLKELLTSLIPENFFKALVNFDVLAVIVATILFSLAVLAVEWERELLLKQLLRELDKSLMKLTGWIIKTAPVGVCALIAGKVASLGGASALKPILYSLSKYVLTVLTGLSIHAFLTLPLLYFLFTRQNPYRLIAKVREALITAFATASSSATLPITIAVATAAGIKRQVAQFTLPLGATVNMDGTALYEAVAAVFLAQAYGIELSLFQ